MAFSNPAGISTGGSLKAGELPGWGLRNAETSTETLCKIRGWSVKDRIAGACGRGASRHCPHSQPTKNTAKEVGEDAKDLPHPPSQKSYGGTGPSPSQGEGKPSLASGWIDTTGTSTPVGSIYCSTGAVRRCVHGPRCRFEVWRFMSHPARMHERLAGSDAAPRCAIHSKTSGGPLGERALPGHNVVRRVWVLFAPGDGYWPDLQRFGVAQ